MKNTIIIAILVLVIAGAGGFFAGTKYQQSKQTTRQFGNRNTVNRSGFQSVNGDIVSSDANSITVKLQDGSSKIVLYSDKTPINKSSQGTPADLKAGENVAVFGQTNSDGSVTAQNIQLNPVIRNIPTPTSQ